MAVDVADYKLCPDLYDEMMDPIELSKWMRDNQDIVKTYLENGVLEMKKSQNDELQNDIQKVFEFALEYDKERQEYERMQDSNEYERR